MLSLTLCAEMKRSCNVFLDKRKSCHFATRICDPEIAFYNDHTRQRNMDIVCDISKLCFDAEGLGLVTIDSQNMNQTEMWSAIQTVCTEEGCNLP
jgi:hypothetical protein